MIFGKKNRKTKSGVTKGKIIGNWEANERGVTAKVTLSENGKFSGVLYKNNKVTWIYSGSWNLNGDKLTWYYEESTPPLQPEMKNKPDVNQVLSFHDNNLVLKEENGETSKYQKI